METAKEVFKKIMVDRPVEPLLSKYGLEEKDQEYFNDLKRKSKVRADYFLNSVWIVISILVIILNFLSDSPNFTLIICTPFVLILVTFPVVPRLVRNITKKELNQIFYELLLPKALEEKAKSYNLFQGDYQLWMDNLRMFEKRVSKVTSTFWLSLTFQELEQEVASLFENQGWEVQLTSYKNDNGIDILMKKKDEISIVQCKNYKNIIGPNILRELYGTMIAASASSAYLVAPNGFSQASKTFCNGKPIKLLDVDDLGKMSFPFDNYTPHWINTAQSVDQLVSRMNSKRSSRRKRY